MKITQNPISPNLVASPESRLTERASTNTQHAPEKTSRGGAHVELSDDAKLVRRGVEEVKGTALDRAARVAELKKAVKAGTYQVDSAAIADRLVDEHFMNELAAGNS